MSLLTKVEPMHRCGLVVLCISGWLGLASCSERPDPTDTLAKIKATHTITMGIRESSVPLSYINTDLEPIGYHIDACNRVVEAIRVRLGLPDIKIVHQAVTSQNRIPLVTNGTVDIECGSTTNNVARQRQVAFAPATFVTNVRMAVKKNSGITELSQLNGRPVVATSGTTSVKLLRARTQGMNLQFSEVYGKDHGDSFLMLETDRAVAFVLDDNLLAGLIATAKEPRNYAIVGETLSIEPIAIMFRKDDPAFKKLVDETIIGMMNSGELENLYKKWFMSPIPPRGVNLDFPMNETLKQLIHAPSDQPAEAFNKKS